ncbi:MAG: hypothetical protein V4795_12610 [Pseudomonadota bacterium]
MTTNVYDSNVGLVATDSRWSIQQGRWLVYVDDVPFYKIETLGQIAFMFAGKGRKIQEWKYWIRTEPADLSARPSVDGISVCLVQMASKEVLFCEKQDIVKDGASFAGSGSRFAYMCWSVNRDARKSVESAKRLDPASGGDVKFLQFLDRANNFAAVVAEATIDMVDTALQKRGMVMDLYENRKGGAPFKLSDIAGATNPAVDEDLLSLHAKVVSGEASAEAPCDGMYSDWTAEQEARLNSALTLAFGWDKK